MAAKKTPFLKNIPLLIAIGVWVVWGLFARSWYRMDKPWEIEGEPTTTADFIAIGLFPAGAIALGLAALLLITKRWWLPLVLKRNVIGALSQSSKFSIPKWTWLGIIGILIVAACLRGPMMNRQVLRDEQDNLRRNIFGFHYIELHHQDLRFFEVEWPDAFFENRLANNPILFSVLSKASLEIWRKVSGAPEDQFNKVALRMPSLIFGLGSIFMLFLIFSICGRASTGLIAALLAALHPLHIRYSTEARGYGIVLLFVATAILFGILAVGSGRWRYWLGFAFSLLGILYAFAGGIYFVLPTGLAMAGFLLFRWGKKRSAETRAAFLRFSLCAVIAGTTYAVLVAPSLPQISRHLSGKYEKIPLHPRWLFVTLTQYTSGIWVDAEVADHLKSKGMELEKLSDGNYTVDWNAHFSGVADYLTTTFIRDEPLHAALIFLIMPALAIIGFIGIWRQKGILPWLALAGVLAPVLDFSHHQFITGLYAYFWYWIYSLLWFLAFIAIGITILGNGIAKLAKKPSLAPITTAIVAALFFGIYIVETSPKKSNRFSRSGNPGSGKTVFPRGKSEWAVYANGFQFRARKDEEIPETFSSLEKE